MNTCMNPEIGRAAKTAKAWSLYDQMIEAVPDDIGVVDYALGVNWSYVECEAGSGVSYTASGGAKGSKNRDYRGMNLREMAALSKSWCFEEATLGVAALNAWYNNRSRLEAGCLSARFEEPQTVGYGSHRDVVGEKLDAFDHYRPEIETVEGARVVVVGHFPHVEKVAEYADLTVLERRCTDGWDTPDPACEYVMPLTDFAFITGVTIINKTAPRLLTLAADARVIMVGPSVVMCKPLLDCGVETMSGSVVTDPEALKFYVKNGAGRLFGEALQMCTVFTERTPL